MRGPDAGPELRVMLKVRDQGQTGRASADADQTHATSGLSAAGCRPQLDEQESRGTSQTTQWAAHPQHARSRLAQQTRVQLAMTSSEPETANPRCQKLVLALAIAAQEGTGKCDL